MMLLLVFPRIGLRDIDRKPQGFRPPLHFNQFWDASGDGAVDSLDLQLFIPLSSYTDPCLTAVRRRWTFVFFDVAVVRLDDVVPS